MTGRSMWRWMLAGVAGIVVLGSVNPVHASVDSNVRFTDTIFAVNDCNGETVTIPVEIHLMSKMTSNEDGSFHGMTHLNAHGSGTGSLGNTYQVSVIDKFVGNTQASGDGQSEFTQTTSFRAVSQGPAPNILVHSVLHLTFNANGELTAFAASFTSECDS